MDNLSSKLVYKSQQLPSFVCCIVPFSYTTIESPPYSCIQNLNSLCAFILTLNQPHKLSTKPTAKMQFAILAASIIATASAAPSLIQTRQTIADGKPFGLVVLATGSPVHVSPVAAASNGLALKLAKQGAADCTANTAYFVLKEGALQLYTPEGITQELYTDRSGMGQGVLQYSTQPGGLLPGKNAETVGWAIDGSGDLTFDGSSFIACPSDPANTDAEWNLWVAAGVKNPGFSEGCVGVSARAMVGTEAQTCTYSYTKA